MANILVKVNDTVVYTGTANSILIDDSYLTVSVSGYSRKVGLDKGAINLQVEVPEGERLVCSNMVYPLSVLGDSQTGVDSVYISAKGEMSCLEVSRKCASLSISGNLCGYIAGVSTVKTSCINPWG